MQRFAVSSFCLRCFVITSLSLTCLCICQLKSRYKLQIVRCRFVSALRLNVIDSICDVPPPAYKYACMNLTV
ncbi:hypothetical protein BKA93DRAFT_455364 [Sparassis latifolia]